MERSIGCVGNSTDDTDAGPFAWCIPALRVALCARDMLEGLCDSLEAAARDAPDADQ